MRTRDLHQKTGELTGFRVSNFWFNRFCVPRVINTIPGSQVVRKQKIFEWFGPDGFCEFILEGQKFFVIEPFGDNSEYWVVTDPPCECEQLKIVRQAFEKYNKLRQRQT